MSAPDPATTAPAHTAPPPRAMPGGGQQKLHRLVAVVADRPGVLNRVSSLMRARNFNIDSLAVSRTDREGFSRMTISLHGDDIAVEQAAKQLYRLIDVLKVQDVTAEPTVEHELALVKVRVSEGNRGEVLKLIELARGRVLDVSAEAVIAEVSGSESEVDEAIRFAQAVKGPALIWFEIAGEQNVFPMMPAGKGLSDLIEEWGASE